MKKISFNKEKDKQKISLLMNNNFNLNNDVFNIIWNYVKYPKCGDGSSIKIIKGCGFNKENDNCMNLDIKINKKKYYKWYCNRCIKFILIKE